MYQAGPRGASFGAATGAPVDRRDQREREGGLGLVPFAVKLKGVLVKQLQDLAQERGLDMNELVADVLKKGLAS
jgi:hypothetical protein